MYKRMLQKLSGIVMDRFSQHLVGLKKEVEQSNLEMVFELYVGKMVLFSIVGFLFSMILFSIGLIVLTTIPVILSLFVSLIIAFLTSALMVMMFYMYPYQKLTSQKNDIEASMPFAIGHMAAVGTSGAPPFVIFKLLNKAKEYGEISREAGRIVRNMDVMGMDVATAVEEVAKRTPSEDFSEFLYGFVSTIRSGGELQEFLKNQSEKAQFEYKTRRDKYLSLLSTYADFYTAILVAAPLFFMSILAVLALIGGPVMGFSPPMLMRVGLFVIIPLINTLFLTFIHLTQPKV